MKQGQKVIYNDEIRVIYDIYPNNMASLCLMDEDGSHYTDTEADELTSISELKPVNDNLIFNDIDGNELNIGDKVVTLDVNDLDYPMQRGMILKVIKLIDIESNLIEFKSLSDTYTFYGHRILKLKL